MGRPTESKLSSTGMGKAQKDTSTDTTKWLETLPMEK